MRSRDAGQKNAEAFAALLPAALPGWKAEKAQANAVGASMFGGASAARSVAMVRRLRSRRRIKVVGVVWGATDQFALAEDVRGNSFVLRKGDKVQNGYVEALRRDAVVVNLTAEGQTQSVVIPLVRKGDSNAR